MNNYQFGYNVHTNIVAKAPTMRPKLKNAVFNKFNISGHIADFQYLSENEIFDADETIAALRSELGVPKMLAHIAAV